MSSRLNVCGLGLAYENNEKVSSIITESGDIFSDIKLQGVTSKGDGDSVERIIGEDGAGVRITIDIKYNESDTVQDVIIHRGRSNYTYGSISQIVI